MGTGCRKRQGAQKHNHRAYLQAHCISEKAKEFSGQLEHDAAPGWEMEDLSHGRQTVAPAIAGGDQVSIRFCRRRRNGTEPAEEGFPRAPGLGAYVPAGHSSHDVIELFRNVPGMQRQSERSAEASDREAVRGGHTRQGCEGDMSAVR